jgi:hypothetical protein
VFSLELIAGNATIVCDRAYGFFVYETHQPVDDTLCPA